MVGVSLIKLLEPANLESKINMRNRTDIPPTFEDHGAYLEEIEEIVHEEVIETLDEMDDDPGIEYYCTRCGLDFRSVAAHLQQYHRDEPLVVDMVEDCAADGANFQLIELNCDDLIEEDVTLPESSHEESYLLDDSDEPSGSVATVDPVEERTCLICQTVFSSKLSLQTHMRMHNPPKPQSITVIDHDYRIRCGECGETFSHEDASLHAETHQKKKHHLCEICNRRFVSNDVLLMHMQNHEVLPLWEKKPRKESSLKRAKPEGKRAYPCQYCGKEFYRPYEKVEHERIHTGEKPFPCQICGKSFRVAYCLTLHMRTHLDQRPYTCEQCEKSFSSNSAYAHHLLTHSDERKYECPFCSKTFKTLVQLTGHRKSHTRPFTCTDCSRQFATLYGLRNHMELHQRTDKPAFCCKICGATYGRQSSLREHQRVQHRSRMREANADDEVDLSTHIFDEC